MERLRTFILLACLTVASLLSNARGQVVEPQPLVLAQPEAPQSRAGVPIEGWVVARYSVQADGRTSDIEVIDTQPPQLPDRAVTDVIEGWIFEPATVDGDAVEWHNNEALVLLRAAQSQSAPSPFFLTAYREVQAELDEGDFDRARRSNQRMLATATRLVEIGLGHMQSAIINLQLGDRHAAYAAILRATDLRAPTLEGEDLRLALQYRNVLEMQFNDLFGVLETLERRNALEPVPADDPVAANAAAVEQALAQGGAVVQEAKILEDAWYHALNRRIFAISEVDGNIDTIRVWCDRRITELEFAPDSEWALPEAWGDCAIAVEGRDDTQFRFYEFQ